MLDEALTDLRLGISQIRLRRDGKSPDGRWKEFTERLPAEAELRDWFGVEGRFNRGIVMGRVSGLVGVDVDDVARGFAFLRERGVPATVMQTRTWRKRYHLLFRHPGPEVRPAVKVCREPVDVRGDDSYLVAAGSRIDGQGYDRLGLWEKSAVPVFDPRWLQETPMDTPRPPPSPLVSTRLESVRRYIAKIVAASGQGGHNATYRATCKAADAGLSFDEILALLVEWNETNALPKWDLGSLVHKTRSALSRTLKRKA